MKRLQGWVVWAGALAIAAPAFAGGHKCTKSAADCKEEMTAHYKAKGWAGLEIDKSEGKVVVKSVEPGSPAETAGIKAGDVLVALNGVSFGEENKEALYKVKKSLSVGSNVTYTVSRSGAEQKVSLSLAPVPETVIARWLDDHMKQHAAAQPSEN